MGEAVVRRVEMLSWSFVMVDHGMAVETAGSRLEARGVDWGDGYGELGELGSLEAWIPISRGAVGSFGFGSWWRRGRLRVVCSVQNHSECMSHFPSVCCLTQPNAHIWIHSCYDIEHRGNASSFPMIYVSDNSDVKSWVPGGTLKALNLSPESLLISFARFAA